MLVLIVLGLAALPLLALTALIEHMTQEALPTGCPVGCSCRGL